MSHEHDRAEIAAVAARLIAETGLDWKSARRKAAREVVGADAPHGDVMPDDVQVDAALREYQRLFQADTQPARLLALREVALEVMELIPQQPLWLVGAAANGTAGEHSDVYLHAYVDSSKDLHIDLLNAGVEVDVDEIANPFGRGRIEQLVFAWAGEEVHISCYPPNQARQMSAQVGERLDHRTLLASVQATAP